MIKLTIPGKPMGKQRPKFARMGKFVSTRTPTKTVNYEALVAMVFVQNYPCGCHQPFAGPVTVVVRAYYPIPKSKPKKVKLAMASGITRPTVMPDVDNILKIITDALNGLVYLDDKQVIDATVGKWYSDTPRVEVTIREAQQPL